MRNTNLFYLFCSFTSVQNVLSSKMKTMFQFPSAGGTNYSIFKNISLSVYLPFRKRKTKRKKESFFQLQKTVLRSSQFVHFIASSLLLKDTISHLVTFIVLKKAKEKNCSPVLFLRSLLFPQLLQTVLSPSFFFFTLVNDTRTARQKFIRKGEL